MTPLSALLVRDMRIAVRVGGGALIGVLFFLVVVTLTPFAIGPDLAQRRHIQLVGQDINPPFASRTMILDLRAYAAAV